MKNYWFVLLCAVALVFSTAGCGTTGRGADRKGRWVSSETGSLLPRWVDDSRGGRDSREARRNAKAKRDAKKKKDQKAKRDTSGGERAKRRQQNRGKREKDEEVITRGGFR